MVIQGGGRAGGEMQRNLGGAIFGFIENACAVCGTRMRDKAQQAFLEVDALLRTGTESDGAMFGEVGRMRVRWEGTCFAKESSLYSKSECAAGAPRLHRR